jgi:hypothetical protein
MQLSRMLTVVLIAPWLVTFLIKNVKQSDEQSEGE